MILVVVAIILRIKSAEDVDHSVIILLGYIARSNSSDGY